MPDGLREPFRPIVRIKPVRPEPEGFTAGNTSGVNEAELASLNRALTRLMEAGLAEYESKVAIDAAVRTGLKPLDTGEAPLEQLNVVPIDRLRS